MKLLGLSLLAIPSLLVIPIGAGVLLVALGGLVVGPFIAGSFAADGLRADEPVPEPSWRTTRPPL
jgi:hypothetical protein